MEYPLGDDILLLSGTAFWVEENLSSGEAGDPDEYIAFFVRAKIRNWKSNSGSDLTITTINAIEESIVENFNNNYELCTSLANQTKE